MTWGELSLFLSGASFGVAVSIYAGYRFISEAHDRSVEAARIVLEWRYAAEAREMARALSCADNILDPEDVA